MQQVQKLDEVPGVLAGTFLRSGLPAAVVVFRQAVQLVLVLIQAGRLVCCGVLLAIIHADADDPVVLQQDPAFLVDLILFVLRMICAPYSSVCMVDSSFTLEI